MKKYWIKIPVFVLLIAVAAFLYLTFGRFVTFAAVKNNSIILDAFVQKHYFLSLAALALAFLSTAFFLPGSLILTIGSGFLFGAGMGAVYTSVFLTAGSILAFLASRHLIGNTVQQRFKQQLARFNREIHRYGRNYLFILHIQPVLPSFLINYLSGLTEMPVRRFAFVTFFSLLPGSFVYSFAGRQLASMQSASDILSSGVLIGIGLLAVLALIPVLAARLKHAAARS
jgi:uncharacterized membrane protein YdjX (TVP38/TMEM64 family)